MNLRECLEEYRNLTLKLIENTQGDKELNSLIEKREKILKVISELKFTSEEFTEIADSLEIQELDSKLITLVSKEKNETKEKLNNLKKLRVARKNYNSMPNGSVIFSTRL